MSEQKQRIIFDIPTKEITPFRIRVVMSGENYGRDDCLTHEGSEPLVEFFDKRFPHTPNGQFVSRYYLETIMNISLALCDQKEENHIKALASNYWHGISSDEPVWEYLTTSAEIISVIE